MKDERPYIVEWIAYHRLLGFAETVVYTNDCSDGSDLLLRELAESGLVEHRYWPSVSGESPQVTAYNNAIRQCKTPWIIFIDADEFLNLKVDDQIEDFLRRFPEDVSAIAINWRTFGSSGNLSYDAAPVLSRFVRTALPGHHLNRHCKTVARARDISDQHIHRCFLKRGRYVNVLCKDIEIERMGFTPTVEHEVAQINHYVIKSRAEFEEKRLRGNANRSPESRDKYTTRDGDYFARHDLNDGEDTSILRRYDEFRLEMDRLCKLAQTA